jgi:hypothetical protein
MKMGQKENKRIQGNPNTISLSSESIGVKLNPTRVCVRVCWRWVVPVIGCQIGMVGPDPLPSVDQPAAAGSVGVVAGHPTCLERDCFENCGYASESVDSLSTR